MGISIESHAVPGHGITLKRKSRNYHMIFHLHAAKKPAIAVNSVMLKLIEA